MFLFHLSLNYTPWWTSCWYFHALIEILLYLLKYQLSHTHVHTHTMETVFLFFLIIASHVEIVVLYTHSLITVFMLYVNYHLPFWICMVIQAAIHLWNIRYMDHSIPIFAYDWKFYCSLQIYDFNKCISSYFLFHFCLMYFHLSFHILHPLKYHCYCILPLFCQFLLSLNFRTELKQLLVDFLLLQ